MLVSRGPKAREERTEITQDMVLRRRWGLLPAT